MLAPPTDLHLSVLSAALTDGWGIHDPLLDYLAVGFGSHHWRAEAGDGCRWFVTVDEHRDPSSIADLRRAFDTASALHRDAGLAFVLAPVPDRVGEPVRVLGGGAFTVAVTTWVDASPLGPGPYASDDDRAMVLRMLGRLHRATPLVAPTAAAPAMQPIELDVPHIDGLRAALDAIDEPWGSGPYAEPARALLRVDEARLTVALARHDELAACVLAESSPWVLTHGEPHSANILRDAGGALHLIDWDTARLAPRERDLWMVTHATTDLQPYVDIVGDVPLSAAALRLFRMRWDLSEIAVYVSGLHAPHEDDPNTREAWDDLAGYLPVSEDHLASVPG